MKDIQLREIAYCKEHFPQYVHYLTEDICGSRMKQYNRLFKYDVTPDSDPKIFNIINSSYVSAASYEVSDYIRDICYKRYYNGFINKLKKSNIPLPESDFTIADFESIDIYSIKEIKSLNNTKYLDYIHVELDILGGSLDDKIEFAKEYKELIKFKVYYKLEKKYGSLVKFLKLYEYKFYSKKTVGDSGIVKGLLRFELKDV